MGENATNSIPTEAHASIDFRLVPDQTPEEVRDRVEAFFEDEGWTLVTDEPDMETRRSAEKILRADWSLFYAAARSDMDEAVVREVISAVTQVAGAEVAVVPMLGGSIPMAPFTRILDVPVIGVPIANHDNNQHAANENLRLQNLWTGIEIYAGLMALLSAP